MASFTLTGTIRDHTDQPAVGALVRAVPSPDLGIDSAANVVYAPEDALAYTNAAGLFTMTLVTFPGLYYTVSVSQGITKLVTSITFAAGLSGSTIDLADVTAVPAAPDVINTYLPTGTKNLVVSPTNPNLSVPGLWVQTGLGASGTDMTFWIEDGT